MTLLSIALLRGSIFGAVAGFFAGYLLDVGKLGMLAIRRLSQARTQQHYQLPSAFPAGALTFPPGY